MTDVVKIAKKCHAELTAEIARLDEFLRMAEKLLEYEQKGSGKAPGSDKGAAAGTPVRISASAAAATAGANVGEAKA